MYPAAATSEEAEQTPYGPLPASNKGEARSPTVREKTSFW